MNSACLTDGTLLRASPRSRGQLSRNVSLGLTKEFKLSVAAE